MADKEPKDSLSDVIGVVDAAISRAAGKLKCEHCGKETAFIWKAKFKENKFRMVLNVEKGHMLQAETIGGTLTNLGKMFKARGRDMGVKIEVLVTNIRFTENKITIDILSTLVGDANQKQTDVG